MLQMWFSYALNVNDNDHKLYVLLDPMIEGL